MFLPSQNHGKNKALLRHATLFTVNCNIKDKRNTTWYSKITQDLLIHLPFLYSITTFTATKNCVIFTYSTKEQFQSV